jgi:drug/metabolite transporter (DMT)-like permease
VTRDQSLAIAALLLTMMFWGSGAVFVRSLALSLTPDNSLALRYAIIVPVSLTGLAMLRSWCIRRDHWLRFAITGIIGMAGYNIFVNHGFALVPAGLGAVITSIEPLMITLLAWAMLGERPSPFIHLGILVAGLGAIVLFWQDITGATATGVSYRGLVMLLACCACWAFYTIMAKPLLAHYDSFTVTAVTMLVAAPLLIARATEPLHILAARLDLRQWFELFYLIVPNGIVGTLLWNFGAKRLTGAATGAFLYLIPVIAVVSGVAILGESLTVSIIAGGALTLAGVALAQFGPAVFVRR